MLDIKYIIDNVDEVKNSIAQRNVNANLDALLDVYQALSKVRKNLEDNRAEANKVAKEIPKANQAEKQDLIKSGSALKKKSAELEEALNGLQLTYDELMLTIPNKLPEDTPAGFDDSKNIVLRVEGDPTSFDFKPKDHLQLGTDLDLIDFESGAKVSGAKFYYLKNEAVLLEMAIKHFALSVARQHGYTLLQTPDVARSGVLESIGFSPRGNESNTYVIEGHDLCLIGTAEITVGGMHANEILNESDLPLKYVADSHCFRTEAGAAGQAGKGLYRVHQFSKIEMFQFTKPELSSDALEEILSIEEEIYKGLEIPYQVVRICAGDLGAPAYMKYDIEAWMPGKGDTGGYGEITSASNCTDFQARRLKTRYKDKNTKKNTFVHTLNGTATAISRTLIAILENHQNKDGSITVPEVLRALVGQDKISAIASSPDFAQRTPGKKK